MFLQYLSTSKTATHVDQTQYGGYVSGSSSLGSQGSDAWLLWKDPLIATSVTTTIGGVIPTTNVTAESVWYKRLGGDALLAIHRRNWMFICSVYYLVRICSGFLGENILLANRCRCRVCIPQMIHSSEIRICGYRNSISQTIQR